MNTGAAVALPASVTMQDATAALRAVEAALAAGSGPLAIDASAVAEVDSAAVALLLQAQRLARACGRTVALQGAPAKLVALAELYGVGSLLGASGSA